MCLCNMGEGLPRYGYDDAIYDVIQCDYTRDIILRYGHNDTQGDDYTRRLQLGLTMRREYYRATIR